MDLSFSKNFVRIFLAKLEIETNINCVQDLPDESLPKIPSPPKIASNSKKFAALLVIIVLGLGMTAFFIAVKWPVVTKRSSLSILPKAPITPAQEKSTLLKWAEQDFPAPTTLTPAQLSALPEPLPKLVLADSINLDVSQAVFDNQKAGFEINYSVNQDLPTAYYSLMNLANNNSAWAVIKSARSSNFAVSYLEVKNYNVQITFNVGTPSSTTVISALVVTQ